jgi:hypothetical protein
MSYLYVNIDILFLELKMGDGLAAFRKTSDRFRTDLAVLQDE